MMKISMTKHSTQAVALGALLFGVAGSALADEVTFNGTVSTDFTDTNNWSTLAYPTSADYAVINTTAELTNAAPNNIMALRIAQADSDSVGVFNVRGTNASISVNSSSNWDTHIGRKGHGTLNILEGGQAYINFAEIGREPGSTGIVNVVDGYLRFTRGSKYDSTEYAGDVSFSVHVGANDHTGDAGYGEINVSGGSFVTRFGVEFGHPTRTPNQGKFSVQGTNAVEITIGDTNDGYWMQNTNSILEIGIDGGVTPINILENGDGTGAGGAHFANGSILDVGFINGYSENGTWAVMNSEGTMVNLGLALSDEAVAEGWDAGIEDNTLYVSYGEDAPGDLEPLTTPLAPSSVTAMPSSNYTVTVTWEEAYGAETYTVQRSTESGGPYTEVASGLTDLSYNDVVPAVDSRYYYTVYGVNAMGDGTVSSEDDAYALDAAVIGVSSPYNDSYTIYNLFDNDTSTHYDDTVATDHWGGLDYGSANKKQILEVAYVLRNYSESKVLPYASNTMFQASNNTNGTWTTLHTIPADVSTAPTWNSVEVSDGTAYQYVRVITPDDQKNKAIAEVKFLTADDYTTNGTAKYWLELVHGLVTDGDYEAADVEDVDDDGFAAWEEYVAGTDPNDVDDFLEVTQLTTTNGVVITWASVEGKTYNVLTNTSLSYGEAGVAAAVTGKDGSTSYTGTVSGASTVFYTIGVE